MMENKELRSRISKAIAKEFETNEELFKPEAGLFPTLRLDSLSLVELVALVEEQTGVVIGDEDIEHINTFKDLYEFVESRMEWKTVGNTGSDA